MIPPGETALMSHSFDSNHTGLELFTFGEAGRLTGKPKAFLKELAEAGQLSVRLQTTDGESKIRVTRSGLTEAGLLQDEQAIALPERGGVGELIALVREQATRISALEEQRFQLGAQLGAAVERVASLEEHVSLLAQHELGHNDAIGMLPSESNGRAVSAIRSFIEVRTRNLHLPVVLRPRFVHSRFRLPERTEDGPAG
jgi:hypothetical protein